MPYITKERRYLIDNDHDPLTAGELNYTITKIINNYLYSSGLSYSKINDVMGVLECAKLELYRRVAVPYENAKLAENGDVFSVS